MASERRSLDLSTTRYKGGVTSYLDLSPRKVPHFRDEVTALNILGSRMASTVLLIQALGGGWDRSSLPERPGVLRQTGEQQWPLMTREFRSSSRSNDRAHGTMTAHRTPPTSFGERGARAGASASWRLTAQRRRTCLFPTADLLSRCALRVFCSACCTLQFERPGQALTNHNPKAETSF